MNDLLGLRKQQYKNAQTKLKQKKNQFHFDINKGLNRCKSTPYAVSVVPEHALSDDLPSLHL